MVRQTERLILFPFTAALASLAFEDRPGLAGRLGATVPEDWPNPDLFEALPFFIEALTEMPELASWLVLAVERAQRVLVGSGGFVGLPDRDGSVELGFGVVPAFQGRGYATEIGREMVVRAFEDATVRQVVARCRPDNAASVCVLERLGFVQCGEDDGHLVWRRGPDLGE